MYGHVARYVSTLDAYTIESLYPFEFWDIMRISFEFIRRKLSRIYSRNPHLQGSNWFRKLKKTYIEMSMKYINTIDTNLKNIYPYGRNDFEFDLNRIYVLWSKQKS